MKNIELRNITKEYGKGENKTCALNKVSIGIDEGELVAIMGTSGSGKTTLLNIIGAIDSWTGGEYYLKGKNIRDYSEKEKAVLRNQVFGFVMQDFALVPHYKVEKNIELPLYYTKCSKKKRKERTDNVLERLHLTNKKHCYPAELSGGQKQRIAIARAIVNEAEILLCDEPTGALDSKTTKEIMDIFVMLNKLGKTIIIVTHDMEVAKYCKRLVKIEDGKIIEDDYSFEE